MNVDPDFDPVQSVGGIRYITIANGTVQICMESLFDVAYLCVLIYLMCE